jgi:chromosomal replication initiator protein
MNNSENTQELWKQACGLLQQNMNKNSFDTWIQSSSLSDFRLIGTEHAIGVISSPTAFHATNVEKNFYAQIKEVLDYLSGRMTELQFKVGSPVVPVYSQPVTKRALNLNDSFASSAPSFTAQPQTPPQAEQQPEATLDNGASQHSFTSFMTENGKQEPEDTPAFPQQQNFPTQNQVPPVIPPISNNISALQERLLNYAQTSSTTVETNPQQTKKQTSSQKMGTPNQANNSNLFSETTIQSMMVDRARVQAQRAGLRLDYTFETFAVSTTNEMAHAAAQAVSSQPGTAYNPLFIYGGVGVGKTHLMHAVGNNILKNNPEVRLLYCTGEDFTNEIVSAIQTKKAFNFKEKYRNVDVLLIDDVQFIAGKNTIQEEFFHTFNTITKRSGQVILTSDRPPSEISLLEDRLKSRFEAGLMVDIQQPSFELRTAILLIKASSYHLEIPMDLAQVIASRVDSARKIEGIIKSIKSEVELKHRAITAEMIDEICKVDLERPVKRLRVKPVDIIRTVSDFYHLKQTVIRGKQRMKSIVKARHIAMYFLKEEINLPFMEIGYWFSNRDHTSAMHAFNKIKQDLQEDPELRQEVASLRSQLVLISK